MDNVNTKAHFYKNNTKPPGAYCHKKFAQYSSCDRILTSLTCIRGLDSASTPKSKVIKALSILSQVFTFTCLDLTYIIIFLQKYLLEGTL